MGASIVTARAGAPTPDTPFTPPEALAGATGPAPLAATGPRGVKATQAPPEAAIALTASARGARRITQRKGARGASFASSRAFSVPNEAVALEAIDRTTYSKSPTRASATSVAEADGVETPGAAFLARPTCARGFFMEGSSSTARATTVDPLVAQGANARTASKASSRATESRAITLV